MYIDAGPQRV